MRSPARRGFSIRRLVATGAAVAALVTGGVAVTQSSQAHAAGYPTIDGQFSGSGPVGPGQTVELDVIGRGGVPASGVAAVALNVTVTNTTAPSYLTVFPAGDPLPTASNLNFVAGQTVPNMVISKVGDGGHVSLFNLSGTVDVVVDVLGWFATGSSYTAVTPRRLLDTRPGYPTIDAQFSGGGPIGSAGQMTVPIAGRGDVPGSADSVVVNVTVTNPTVASYLSLWPAGEARPTAANLNWVPGQTVSNMAIVRLGDGGALSLFNLTGTADVVIDVLGWFPGSGTFTGVTPARLMDSRPGLPTIDAGDQGAGRLGAQDVVTLDVTGRGGVPGSGVGAVALNVTVTEATSDSFLTVWPTGADRPTASNLNFRAGQTVPNMVVVEVGDGGRVSLFNLAGATHVVVDVLGWMPSSGAYTGLVPARLMDTRIDPGMPDPTAPTSPTTPLPDPGDPSLDPFVCRTYTQSIVGNVTDTSLDEISGMARGRRNPSVIWVHEDSGAQADVHALAFNGQKQQTFRLTGATNQDWEDMDVGPGPQAGTHYLYLGDIGGGGRTDITVWRVPEPAVTGGGGTTQLAGAEAIRARYPSGGNNAESMAVGADGTIYVITKSSPTRVFAIPYPQSTAGVTTMTQIDAGVLGSKVDMSGADIRPDGRALIVRGYRDAWTWPINPGESMATTLARTPCDTDTFRDEPQGEAIAFLGNDGSYISTSEIFTSSFPIPLRQYRL
ncbi:MAG: hypothetical protein AB7L17_04925 [Ilumatobacteraceae bacterium]